MGRKLVLVASLAVLIALPLAALAGQQFKNHGQCVSACVKDLGIEQNKSCSALCKDGAYGQDPGGDPPGGDLPAGAPCDPLANQCAAPFSCKPMMMGAPTPMYLCM